MHIKDISPNNPVEFLKFRVLARNGPRMFGGKGRKRFLTEALIIDENGDTCTIVVWDKEGAEELKPGKIHELWNGWAKEYRGVLQVSKGRDGNIIVFEKDDPSIPRSLPNTNDLDV